MTTEVSAPNGLLDFYLTRIFGRSWRTTLLGIAGVFCGVVPLVPAFPESWQEIAKGLAPILTSAGLMLAKDGRVSGLPKFVDPIEGSESSDDVTAAAGGTETSTAIPAVKPPTE
jgi:hypothetical protein